MTKYSILTLCFLLISFGSFAQDYEGETGSTSEENKTIVPTEEGETVFYKGLSFSNPTEPTGDYKIVYDDGMFGVSIVGSGGTTSDYCDCSFELKEVIKANGYTFYETGNCISEKFESGTEGVYIKNEKGYTVIAYFNYGTITTTRLLALTEDDLQEAVTTNFEELQEMIDLLVEWYKK